jgi:Metallo-peptidase family M12B Reprolysin-like
MRPDYPEPQGNESAAQPDPFSFNRDDETDPEIHVFGNRVVCETDSRGHATPRNRGLVELVLDSSEGFIPLWAPHTTLRWRFQERSMRVFRNPAAAKARIEQMLGEAVLAWGNAAPVRFAKRQDAWDFEIVVREADRCNINGCVLASAFFPDAGRHELVIYPKLFSQNRSEQVETLVHEIGHAFGLRHFFANVSETAFPSIVFGTHAPFTIMNYGNESVLTDADRADLRRLYQAAWSGALTHINRTPIKLVKPFHTVGAVPSGMLAAAEAPAVVQPQGPYMTGV